MYGSDVEFAVVVAVILLAAALVAMAFEISNDGE